MKHREEEVAHYERVGEVGHDRVVLRMHDLLVGQIKEAKPVLTEGNLSSQSKCTVKNIGKFQSMGKEYLRFLIQQ